MSQPPFMVDGKSVFSDLSLADVFSIIALLKREERILVLSYLGYFPFSDQRELAQKIGYQDLPRPLSINDLTESLFALKQQYQSLSPIIRRKPRVRKISDEVKDIISDDPGRLRSDRVQRRNDQRAPSFQYLLDLDLNSNKVHYLYDHVLTDRQKTILKLIKAGCSSAKICYELEIKDETLHEQIRHLAAKFKIYIDQGSSLRADSKLRKMAQELQERDPLLLIRLYLENIELGLLLGKNPDVPIPLGVNDVAKHLGVKKAKVYARLKRLLSEALLELERCGI